MRGPTSSFSSCRHRRAWAGSSGSWVMASKARTHDGLVGLGGFGWRTPEGRPRSTGVPSCSQRPLPRRAWPGLSWNLAGCGPPYDWGTGAGHSSGPTALGLLLELSWGSLPRRHPWQCATGAGPAVDRRWPLPLQSYPTGRGGIWAAGWSCSWESTPFPQPVECSVSLECCEPPRWEGGDAGRVSCRAPVPAPVALLEHAPGNTCPRGYNRRRRSRDPGSLPALLGTALGFLDPGLGQSRRAAGPWAAPVRQSPSSRPRARWSSMAMRWATSTG